MNIELTMLAFSILLGFEQVLLAAHFKTRERGLDWNVGARDGPEKPLGLMAGRFDRASRNFLETFPFFLSAVLMAAVLGRHNWLTQWGAVLYFAGRLNYVPLYAWGVPVIRTIRLGRGDAWHRNGACWPDLIIITWPSTASPPSPPRRLSFRRQS